MFRKRKRKHNKKGNPAPYPVIYGFGDQDETFVQRKKKKNKIKTIMGFTPLGLELFCENVPIRTDITIERTYFNFKPKYHGRK